MCVPIDITLFGFEIEHPYTDREGDGAEGSLLPSLPRPSQRESLRQKRLDMKPSSFLAQMLGPELDMFIFSAVNAAQVMCNQVL